MSEIKYGSKTKMIENAYLVFLCLCYFSLQGLTFYLGRTPYGVYNGVVVCFQFFLLLLMIKVNSKKGRHISWFCISISTFF